MAREQGKKVKAPSKKAVEEGPQTPEDEVNLKGYTGPDVSKSIGYLEHEPVADNAGLGADADDAGRTKQAKGANSGASPQPATEAGAPSASSGEAAEG